MTLTTITGTASAATGGFAHTNNHGRNLGTNTGTTNAGTTNIGMKDTVTMRTLISPDSERDRPPDEAQRPPGLRRPVARCSDGNGTLTGLFFSDHVADTARAKAMCGLCALRESCLAGALEREEPWGVWGGELLSGGRIIGDKRPCGRPPKHPRPEVVYDEMGPVGVALTSA